MHLLIQKAKQQDRLAQKQLYDQYAASLLSVCRLYISDTYFAEDVLLRAFFKILTHIDSYQEQEHFYAWMRRSKTQKVVLADWNDTYDSIDDTDLDSYAFEESQIQQFIDQLPAASRAVFNLYVFEDYSHKQIAAELGISEGTSKSQLAYAKKRLKQMVNE